MAAFRFLALITVGFVLLLFVFLLHLGHARLEREAVRAIEGPELALRVGEPAAWTVDLGGRTLADAWPEAQRQPRLSLASEGMPAGAVLQARATYALPPEDEGGEPRPFDAVIGGGPLRAQATGEEGALDLGALWMSWEHPLTVTVELVGGAEALAVRPVLRGEVTEDYVEARSYGRVLWIAATVLGAMGFAGLLLTLRGTFDVRQH